VGVVSGTLNPEARLACQPEALAQDDKCSAQLRRLAFMLDTAGWVLYRQGKLIDAEPYLLSSYAIVPRAQTEMHLSTLLARSGRINESLKYFSEARSRTDFARIDSSEAHRELVKSAGGEKQPIPG
jgi:hypothetical protein